MEKISYTEFIDNIVEKSKDSNQILYATIELTNACNFKCKHCYLGSKNKIKYIDKNDLFKILEELKKMGCVSLIITGGEPLLHPDFEEIYVYAKKLGFLITLFTNGYLINDKIVELLNKYKPVMVEISLYGVDDKSYYELTRKKVNYKIIEDNIHKLVSNKIRVRLKTVLLKQTYDEIEKMYEIAHKLNCEFRWDYYVINSITDDNEVINSTKLSEEMIVSKLLKDKDKYELFKSTLESDFEKNDRLFKCEAGKNSIYISSDLLLSICVIAREPYYDLKKGNLCEGIKIVRNFGCKKMPKKSKCFSCENINICRYCPSKFKIANNDYCKPIEKYCNIASKMKNLINKERNIIIKKMTRDEVLLKLDNMYNIISSNMNEIAPTGNSNEEDYINFKKYMHIELDNKTKRWIGAFYNNELIGYFLYKINDGVLNLDEIQIKKSHQGDKCTFIKLFKYILMDDEIKNDYRVMTYVNDKNIKSKAIVEKLGFEFLEKKGKGSKYITSYGTLKSNLEKYVLNT